MNRYAVVTGCSKGIGAATCKKYASMGFKVIGLSRSQPDFDLEHWLEVDLTDDSSRLAAVEKIETITAGRLDVLINNAGRGHYDSWEDSSYKDIVSLFELDFFVVIKLTHELLPLIKVAKGSIINISSAAAFLPIACMGPYCAAKAALSNYANTFRMELKSSGVHLLNVEPGRIATGFSKGCSGSKIVPETPGASDGPDKLVAAIYRAHCRKKREIVFPRWYFWIFPIPRLFRSLWERTNLKKWEIK
jgi:short-subunit dehydrogenase